MYRLLFTLLALLMLPFSMVGRSSDSAIIRKYYSDTLGFKPFLSNGILDSINPRQSFVKWEYNRAGDSSVLSVPPMKNDHYMGFMRVVAPNIYTYYISAQKKNGKVKTLYTLKGISNFIGKIDNQYDAYFWLYFSRGNDISLSPSSATYKIVDNGILIRLKRAYSTDVAYTDYTPPKDIDTYFVGFSKGVVLIKTEHTPGHYTKRDHIPRAVVSSKILDYTFDGESSQSDSSRYTYPCLYNDEKDLLRYIDSKIRYPVLLIEQGVSGDAYARFTVQPDGVVSDIEIQRSVDPLFSKELDRVLKQMSRWAVKGAVNGKICAVEIAICVEIKLL